MSTPYSVPIEAFLKKVEKDREFFNYLKLTDEQAMQLAVQRAENYLKESVGQLTLKCTPEIDFNDFDDVLKVFNNDWTSQEIFLVSSIMYEMYMSRDIAKLKCLDVNFTPTDRRVFDPSNARSTFKDLYTMVCNQNEILIDDYKNKDRLTGNFKSINYAQYDW